MIDYSIIIRTTGKAGEKYQKLLDSIVNLKVSPVEIIVVLPKGVDLPNERIGNETFYFSEKGMVTQRLYGIKKCKTKYALVTDDDIAFNSDFVEMLYEPLSDGKYSFSLGPLLDFFPSKGFKTILSAILGGAVPTFFHKEKYNTILRTTGYSFNRNIDTKNHKLYETQSAAWTCFFCNVNDFKNINLENEMWLDINGYAAHDDTTMFYKAYLMGYKSVVVSDAMYNHLDGKTSTNGINKTVIFASAFNTFIFWHRFIYSIQKNNFLKLWSIICFKYMLFMNRFYSYVKLIIGKCDKYEIDLYKNGYKEAKKWVKGYEYKILKKVKVYEEGK